MPRSPIIVLMTGVLETIGLQTIQGLKPEIEGP